MSKHQKRILLTVTFLYTLLILYFLFVGFGRLGNSTMIGYRFNLIPLIFSENYRKLFSPSLFNLGNLIAFIPFGILIPSLWKTNYLKFILAFIIGIVLIELLQMLTFLGSADIDDVSLNSLGATIGYLAFYISSKFKITLGQRLLLASVIALLVTLAILVVFA